MYEDLSTAPHRGEAAALQLSGHGMNAPRAGTPAPTLSGARTLEALFEQRRLQQKAAPTQTAEALQEAAGFARRFMESSRVDPPMAAQSLTGEIKTEDVNDDHDNDRRLFSHF